MAKTSKSKTGQYRITIPPSIMTVFNLGMVWSMTGLVCRDASIKETKIISYFASSLIITINQDSKQQTVLFMYMKTLYYYYRIVIL